MGPTGKRPAHVPRSVWWRIPQARRRLWWEWHTPKYNADAVQYLLERPAWVKLTRRHHDSLAAVVRWDRAVEKNKGQPLTFEQLRPIGFTPKGYRSSTGRKPWTADTRRWDR